MIVDGSGLDEERCTEFSISVMLDITDMRLLATGTVPEWLLMAIENTRPMRPSEKGAV
jgi:hypothetical protein